MRGASVLARVRGLELPGYLPTVLLGCAVALLGWRVGMNPPGPGLDSSWNAGLAMAVKDGLRFGSDVVFSYGPLGFLQGQSLWYTDLSLLAFAFSASLYVAFCIALVSALRRVLPAVVTVVVAFVVVSLPLVEQAPLLAVLVCMGALARERSDRVIWALAIGGASFAAVEALVKLSTGPLVAVIFLVTLIGLRARWWQVVAFLGLFAGEVVLFWQIAGQSLSAAPAFLVNTWQIASGYSAAMSRQVDVPEWQVNAATFVAAIVTLALVAATALAPFRDVWARRAAISLMALAGFAVFKEGVVRPDAGHLSLFFSTACVLWIAVPWTRARWPWMLAGVVTIGVLGIPVRPPGSPGLEPIANVRYAGDQVRSLFSSSRRAELSALGRAGMKATYRLDPETRAALQGHSVAIDPWEIGAAWAYELDWAPLPVFQNYSAYTSELDHLNASKASSPAGPERILREDPLLVFPEFPTRGIDNRFPGWDPPAQARAILCHFVVLRETSRWQVLGRVPNRCGRPQSISSVEASPGETVPVPAPAPGEVVFARVEGADVEGLERILSLFLRAPTRHLSVDDAQNYRLTPGTATDGLMLRGSDGLGGKGAFAQIPNAKTVAITGTNGDVRFDFFRMSVRGSNQALPSG